MRGVRRHLNRRVGNIEQGATHRTLAKIGRK